MYPISGLFSGFNSDGSRGKGTEVQGPPAAPYLNRTRRRGKRVAIIDLF